MALDMRVIKSNLPSCSPAGEKPCNGAQYYKLNVVNYSSCYATSRVCRVKRKSLGKQREKASAEELQGPSLHSAPGYFYAFYFPSNELFTFFFFCFLGATIIRLVLVSLVAPGKKQGGELEGIEMCIWISVCFI